MFKIKEKIKESNNSIIYNVCSVRSFQNDTEFLIYTNDWVWVDAKNYELIIGEYDTC